MIDDVAMMWLNMVHVAWGGGLLVATSSLNRENLIASTKMKEIFFVGMKTQFIRAKMIK